MTNNNKLPEGFSIRPGTMEDIPTAVAFFNRCSLAIRGKETSEESDVKMEWTSPGFNQETDQRVVFGPGGELVGYCEVWTTEEMPVHPWTWVRVHPDYQGQGIGKHLLSWAKQRASKVLEVVPPEVRVSFRIGTDSSYQPQQKLYTEYGLQVIRHAFEMQIDMQDAPPAPVWPEGIELRPYTHPADGRAVFDADDEAFQDHFGYVPQDPEKEYERFMHFMTESDHFDPELWFLAYDGDQIAGISLGLKWSRQGKELGWIDSLAVRRPWRKRGLGLALLHHTFNVYWQRGLRSVGLGVDAENLSGALKLYKRAGMYVKTRFDLYEKELRPGVELATVQVEY